MTPWDRTLSSVESPYLSSYLSIKRVRIDSSTLILTYGRETRSRTRLDRTLWHLKGGVPHCDWTYRSLCPKKDKSLGHLYAQRLQASPNQERVCPDGEKELPYRIHIKDNGLRDVLRYSDLNGRIYTIKKVLIDLVDDLVLTTIHQHYLLGVSLKYDIHVSDQIGPDVGPDQNTCMVDTSTNLETNLPGTWTKLQIDNHRTLRMIKISFPENKSKKSLVVFNTSDITDVVTITKSIERLRILKCLLMNYVWTLILL